MTEFDEASAAYLGSIRRELPLYDRLQEELVKATYGVSVKRILDLGCGTGETSRRVLGAYPDAELFGIDPSEQLLQIARGTLGSSVQLRLGFLDEPLPRGPFDLVVSALSVQTLSVQARADCFGAVRRALSGRGRFVVADLIADPAPSGDAVIGRTDTLDALVGRLRDAGLAPEVTWAQENVVVVASSPVERRSKPRRGGD